MILDVGSKLIENYSEFVSSMKEYHIKRVNELGRPDNFPNVMASLRLLIIASSSLILSRFDRTLRKMRLNTLINDMNRYRAKNIGAREMIVVAKRQGDPITNTGMEKLRFLATGSPKLRYILHTIHTYVLPSTVDQQPRKLLITEDVPLNAFFYESVCNFCYVNTEVLHAGLSDSDRVNLVKRFNDPKDDLLILIIMYQVSAQGVNLNPCCCRVIITTPAINAPSEIQAWSRVIRVSPMI